MRFSSVFQAAILTLLTSSALWSTIQCIIRYCRTEVAQSLGSGRLLDDLLCKGQIVIRANRSSKLLLIEDNQFFAMVTQQVLEEQGYQCIVASLMAQAFDFCRSEKFDLCICDYTIPDSSGFESIRMLKKLVGVPVILISGEQNPRHLSRLKREKIIDQFIQKPFTKELIINSINELIS